MRKTLLALAAVACVVPALALAAKPKKDSEFSYCENGNNCPLAFETTPNGRKIEELTMYNKCSTVPPVEGRYPKVRVKDTGKFKKSGTVMDVIGQELEFTFKGKFKKPKKAVGTFEIDSSKGQKECDAEPEEFVAKRTGPAQ